MDEKAHQDRKIVKDLQKYTDDELWSVVGQRLTQEQDTRLRELIALGKQEHLIADEKAERSEQDRLASNPDKIIFYLNDMSQ